MAMDPKPVKLTRIAEEDYKHKYRPENYLVVGDIPGTGAGSEGVQGPPGPAGPPGADGARGERGLTGDPGPAGPQGPIGNSVTIERYLETEDDLDSLGLGLEDTGKSYLTLDTGRLYFWTGTQFNDVGPIVGPQGIPGAAGARGDEGPQGERGLPGTPGPTGETGVQGPAGAPGATGATGAQGDPGPAGEQGPEGPEGPRGPEGPQGVQGIRGERGLQGDQGLEGPQGRAGNSVTIERYLETLAELNALEATLTEDDAGKSYVTMEEGRLHFWTGTSFTDAGKIVGPQGIPGVAGERGDAGPQGPQGERGIQGPAGVQGIQGAQGPQGERGLQGLAGATGAAGPAGSQGQRGETGPQGPQGVAGTNATPLPSGGTSGQVLTKTGPGGDQYAWVGQKLMVSGNFQTNSPVVLDVGPWRLQLLPNGTNLPLLRINSRSGTVQTDYGSTGAPAGGEGNAFVRVRRNSAVTTTSGDNVSPGAGICHFFIRRTGADEVWEGSAFCPSATGLAIIKAERIL